MVVPQVKDASRWQFSQVNQLIDHYAQDPHSGIQPAPTR